MKIKKEMRGDNMNRMMTVKELANYLNCSESVIRKLKREKKIPYLKLAGKILFNKEKIDKWIQALEVEVLI